MSATTKNTAIASGSKSETKPLAFDAVTHSSDSARPLQPIVEVGSPSRSYLRDAAEHLLGWMDRMKKLEPTPSNVNAMCNLAQQVSTIVKVNIELKKSGL